MNDLAEEVNRHGFAVTSPVMPEAEIEALVAALGPFSLDPERRGGVRNLFETVPEIQALAASPAVRGVAESVLGPGCFAVRAILFDKTPAANWKVAWHQDLTIAVQEPTAVPGFGPWTRKAGVHHVQAPAEILNRMLAVRVHLDDCHATNGPLRVIPGSHRAGRLSACDLHKRSRGPSEDALADRGALLAFRPLLLHASSPAISPEHRRVVHLEFAAEELPAPLEWRWRVG